jgi:UDP-glucose-4-epimerase GalE
MSKRAVLVTGGAGYIGSHTCKALALSGRLPVALDNMVHGHKAAVRWGPLVDGDIRDRGLVERTIREHRVDAVVHFAAHAYVGESMHDPGKYFGNNAAGSLALLEAARACGVGRVVFSSTCATYGIPESLPIHDAHAQRPINPYGESKLFVERALHWYGVAHGLRSVALRYFNAAGADPDGEIGEDHDPETHLIPLAIGAALGTSAPLQIYGTDYPTPDGTAVRDYVHVTDLADAHVRALDYLEAGGESTALNLGTGRGHSVHQVVAAVERAARRALPRREAARRPGDPASLVAAPGRSREVLGWAPQRSELEAIIATAWRWHTR